MEKTYTKGGVIVSMTGAPMRMGMFVDVFIMCVIMDVDFDPGGPPDGPGTNSKQQESHQELCPLRPGFDIDKTAENQPDAPTDHHSQSVPEPPICSGPTCLCGALESYRGERGQMIRTREHVKTTGCKTGYQGNHQAAM